MPKVTDDHRKAQEERFVEAARRCFTRLGVDGTSMEEIRNEAGVSAGLMYRYFKSKDDMIRASIAGSMEQYEALLATVAAGYTGDTAAGYVRALLDAFRQFRHHSEGVDLFKLAIQGWAHAQARPEAKAVVTESFARQLRSYRSVAMRWTSRRKADDAARAIAAAVIGYLVQSAFSDAEIDVARYCGALTAFGD